MAKKKDEPKEPSEQQLLEQKVDAMMDVKREEPVVEEPPQKSKNETVTGSELPPLDIFAGTGAPEVPKKLLKDVDISPDDSPSFKETKEVPAEPTIETTIEETTPDVPAKADLDDDVSDAAVDEIVAEEGDAVLAAEDAAAKEQAAAELPKRKLHRHPIFWTLITLLAILAVLVAFLLVTGGNVKAPGIHGAESLWNSLKQRL